MSDFKWTDELLVEWANHVRSLHRGFETYNQLEQFRQSKIKKSVLFTTRDGKEIFEGDNCWWVVIHFDGHWTINTNKMNANSSFNHDRLFSSQAAAEEYILMNRPLFSVKEINDNLGGYFLSHFQLTDILKELAKSKLK
jgi:hypothetical protein